MAEVRDLYKTLICELCDDSYPFLSSNGQKLFQLAESIVDRVQKLIDRYLTLKAAATEDLKNLILTHHEHYDGTGFPKGINKEDMSVKQGVLPIAGEFDRVRIVLQGKKERCFDEAWEEIKARNGKSPLGGKFNGHLLKDIEERLKSLNSRNTDKKAS